MISNEASLDTCIPDLLLIKQIHTFPDFIFKLHITKFYRCILLRGFMCINLFISYELVKSWYNKTPWRKYIDFEKISLREMVETGSRIIEMLRKRDRKGEHTHLACLCSWEWTPKGLWLLSNELRLFSLWWPQELAQTRPLTRGYKIPCVMGRDMAQMRAEQCVWSREGRGAEPKAA